jgi:hypothetical protein
MSRSLPKVTLILAAAAPPDPPCGELSPPLILTVRTGEVGRLSRRSNAAIRPRCGAGTDTMRG